MYKLTHGTVSKRCLLFFGGVMKDIIALLIFVCITVVAIYLIVEKRVDWKIATVLLIFAIFASFLAAKYEDIIKFKWGNVEVETAKREIGIVKDEVIGQIRQEVAEQKQSVQLLISNANQTSEKIERQKEAVSQLIETAQKIQQRIDEQKQELQALKDFTENTKADIEKLNYALTQTGLLIIKANYLAMVTKNEFGTPRATKAMQEVEVGINQLLPIAIPDIRERARWVQELKDVLPSPDNRL